MPRLTFKQAILKETPNETLSSQCYLFTHEELTEILNKKSDIGKKKKRAEVKKRMNQLDILTNIDSDLCHFNNYMRTKYQNRGFLNEFYNDVYLEMLLKNIKLQEIQYGQDDEDGSSGVDEEDYIKNE